MSRKAVELSLNTIIIAAIALLVLIVLVIMFTNSSGNLNRTLNDCAAKGGDPDDNCPRTNAECVANGGVPNGPCIFYDRETGVRTTNRPELVCCVYDK